MSNKNRPTPSTTTPATTPATTPEDLAAPPPALDAAAADPAPASEIVADPGTGLAVVAEDDGKTLAHLIPKLPHLKQVLKRIKMVQPEEIDAAIEKLSPDSQAAYEAMGEKMNPYKPGVHTAQTGMQINDIRLYQGTGADPSRPKIVPTGGFYGTDSQILSVPKDFSAQFPTIPNKMVASVIAYIEGRTFWTPRDEKGNAMLPPGVDVKGNAPICRSLDRNRGDRYGDCAACPYRPFRDGKFDRNGCRDEVHLYLVLQGYSGVYRMVLSGTSVKTGALPVRQRIRNWKAPWAYYFAFDSSEEKDGNRRWFQIQAEVATDPKNPQGVAPSPADFDMLTLLSRQVESEFYYKQLAALYTRSETALSGEKPADLANTLAAAAAAGGDAASDYSKNNI